MHTVCAKHITLWTLILGALGVLLPYAMFTHAFEVPDESAHFASLTFLVNQGRMPIASDRNDLSLEEYQTEQIFGIVEGQNKYSYHPEFRIEQIPGSLGKYEQEIKALNTNSNRTTYYGQQAALYPPLYYALTLPLLHLVRSADILTRLFVSRISSVIFTSLVVLFAYHIGKLVFEKKSYAITVAVMTLFFPMTAYIGGGVNSDNLHNLLFAIATLLALYVVKNGWSRNLSFAVGTCIGLDLLTKPQAYILFPIFVLATLMRWKWVEWRSILSSIFYILVLVLLIAGWQEIPKFVVSNPYAAQTVVYGGMANFRTFAAGYVHTHLTEMPVWYWGVFKWFGVILPRPWWWIAVRLMGVSAIGLVLEFVRDIRAHRLSTESRIILFFLGANLLYVAALFWFDWQFYEQFGHSLGLQARYYMPLLISQMSLLLLGLTNLGWNERVKEGLRTVLILFFLGLQLTSVYVQLTSYYDLTSMNTFLSQVSQYKPFFAKDTWWYLWFSLYFAGIITTITLALQRKNKK